MSNILILVDKQDNGMYEISTNGCMYTTIVDKDTVNEVVTDLINEFLKESK